MTSFLRSGSSCARSSAALADEVGALVELDREHRSGLERRFVRAELGAPGAPAGLDPQRVERVVAGVGEAAPSTPALARLVQREIDVARHLDRHVELEARTADVAHARRAHAREAEVDLARVANLSCSGERVEVVGRADAAEQRARVRPHQREHRDHAR